MRLIQDEFSWIPNSSTRCILRKRRDGVCYRCKLPATKKGLCELHYDWAQEEFKKLKKIPPRINGDKN